MSETRDITGVLRFNSKQNRWEHQRAINGPWVEYTGPFSCKEEPEEMCCIGEPVPGGFLTEVEFRLTGEPPQEIGRLILRDGKVSFEGNADESAKLFFASIQRAIDEYIAQKEAKPS